MDHKNLVKICLLIYFGESDLTMIETCRRDYLYCNCFRICSKGRNWRYEYFNSKYVNQWSKQICNRFLYSLVIYIKKLLFIRHSNIKEYHLKCIYIVKIFAINSKNLKGFRLIWISSLCPWYTSLMPSIIYSTVFRFSYTRSLPYSHMLHYDFHPVYLLVI